MAVRAAGSLCVHLARARAAARSCFRASAGRWRSGTTWAPGRPCTCVSRSPSRDHRRPAAALAPRSGAVLWVTAADLAGVPRALERLPAGARFVVSPNAPRGASVAFEVAGCSGFRLGRAGRRAGRMSGALAPPLPHGGGTARHARRHPVGRPGARHAPAAAGHLHRPRRVRGRPLGRPRGRCAGGPHAPSGCGRDRGRRGAGAARPRPAPACRRCWRWPPLTTMAMFAAALGAAGPVAPAAGPAWLGRARRRAHTAGWRASRPSTGPTRARTSGSA